MKHEPASAEEGETDLMRIGENAGAEPSDDEGGEGAERKGDSKGGGRHPDEALRNVVPGEAPTRRKDDRVRADSVAELEIEAPAPGSAVGRDEQHRPKAEGEALVGANGRAVIVVRPCPR